MANELQVVSSDVLSSEEVSELDKHIEATIKAHKNNRQAINRLVFESVAAITEGEKYREKLSNKGWLRSFVGSITGSNRRLQNKINSSYAAAQYAGQQTMQKLAEQNMLSFDLIAAVNNKLNASLSSIDAEFNNIYNGLSLFLKQNRSDMIQMENRIKKLEKNVNLLNWQSSIEYQMFDGIEYAELEDSAKIVCLVRDFLDITEGNYCTSDLLLLKSAMNDIGLSTKTKINYFEILKIIFDNKKLKDKLLGSIDLSKVAFDDSLLFIEGLKKLDLLSNDEKYLIDSVSQISPNYNPLDIRDILFKQFFYNLEDVNIDVEIPIFEFIMEIIYNINQVSHTKILNEEKLPEVDHNSSENILEKANSLFCDKQYKQAFDLYMQLSEQGNPESQNKLGFMYEYSLGVDKNYAEAYKWYKKAADQNFPEALYNLGKMSETGHASITQIIIDYYEAVIWYKKAAELGYAEAQNRLGLVYYKFYITDYKEAFKWFKLAAEQGHAEAQYYLSQMYYYCADIEKNEYEAVKLCKKSANQGYANAENFLGYLYSIGADGIAKDDYESFRWYKKAAEQGIADAQYVIGTYYKKGIGVHQDLNTAVEWLIMAVKQSNDDARNELDNMGIKWWDVI